MSETELKNIVEAALLAAGRPLTVDHILAIFAKADQPEREAIRDAIGALNEEYAGRGIEIRQVASGYRLQVRKQLAPWVSRLWEEKPAHYTRALLETLSLIAYRQPVTRGEIEDVRGVAVSSGTVRTLLERGWVRVLGHRDAPGRPALYGTTREFLDYFNLKSLSQLPTLQELRDIDGISTESGLNDPLAAATGEAPKADDLAEDIEAMPAEKEATAEASSQTDETLH